MLLDSLDRNGNYIFLILVDIQVNQSLEVEIWISNIKVLFDKTFDLSPMVISKFVSTESLYNRHGFFESGNQLFQLHTDWIWVEVLLNSDTILGEFIRKGSDLIDLDISEGGFVPVFVILLPLFKTSPHEASQLHLLSALFEIFKYSRLSLKYNLPVVVLVFESFQMFESFFNVVKLF